MIQIEKKGEQEKKHFSFVKKQLQTKQWGYTFFTIENQEDLLK